MSTLEMRQEILELIENEKDSSLKKLYKLIIDFKNQHHLDKMIAEGEDDINAGHLHSQSEVQKMINDWTK